MDDRRDDWHNRVDQNLASLNAGQLVWEREIRTIRKLLADMDKLLRGDAEKDTDGLIARLHTQETIINMLRAVIDVDRAGNKGLVQRVEDLEGKKTGRKEFWGNITKIVVAIIMSGAIVRLWPEIAKFLSQKPEGPPVIYRHYTIHEPAE